ncbi:MAG: CapA family protein [Patescibacteria group bacterium]|nr:CapA family protein [Patescibacteria group bacterium]
MKLLFVGDVMLGRLVNEFLKTHSPEYVWGDTLTIFKNADLKICNLECVISDIGQPWSQKVFHFRTDAKNVEVLKVAGFDPISIANNHVLDYEYEALLKMTKILSEERINFAGGGASFIEASEPAICGMKGKNIGLIAFTDNEPEWSATHTKPGIFYVPVNLKDKIAKFLLELIKKTRDDVDFLIISAHWGSNWGYFPPANHIPFSHALIDAGADIIFGHSGHVFRGIEIYKEKPIMYCTGNFIDDYAVDEIERNDQSFIFIIETDDNKFKRLLLYPTVIRNFQARLANDFESEKIALKMKDLCMQLKTKALWQEKERRVEIKV